ncbi:galactosylceramide sulfotransferase-like isoform X2 [Ptychodera flava]|uniref:galactosylceramide sulfotransferase-like isoform X2 n=1 Tax=Ptychodera flava TaxID=63121 RepID=UPI00396A4FE9
MEAHAGMDNRNSASRFIFAVLVVTVCMATIYYLTWSSHDLGTIAVPAHMDSLTLKKRLHTNHSSSEYSDQASPESVSAEQPTPSATREDVLDELDSEQTNFSSFAEHCRKVNDIAYLFNRKTGSTTLVTVLHRFAKRNHFSLQKEFIHRKSIRHSGSMMLYHVQGGDGKASGANLAVKRERRTVLERNGGSLNIAEISEDKVQFKVESPATVVLSIVREPSTHFESVFKFFSLDRGIKGRTLETKMNTYLDKPDFYRDQIRRSGERKWFYARNSQAWHLGLDHRYHHRPDIVEKYFETLEKELDLVFVTEYYDHSLLLLRRITCWDIENILFIARRVRSNRSSLDDALRQKIYRWNYVDVRVYRIFNESLWRKIEQYGPDFDRDLQDFRILKDAVTQDCDSKGRLSDNSLRLLAHFGSNVTESRRHFCERLEEWFTLASDLAVSLWDHGPWALSMSVRGKRDPLGEFYPEKGDASRRCMKINYHRRRSETDGRTMNIYMSANDSLLHPEVNVLKNGKDNDSFVAECDLGVAEDFQVTVEGKHTADDYLIDSFSVISGTCT